MDLSDCATLVFTARVSEGYESNNYGQGDLVAVIGGAFISKFSETNLGTGVIRFKGRLVNFQSLWMLAALSTVFSISIATVMGPTPRW